jgi:Isochorismatase family
VTPLILTGDATTGVVEGMLRDARDQDGDGVVVRDSCAVATAQAHDAWMDLVFARMAWVATVDDVIDRVMDTDVYDVHVDGRPKGALNGQQNTGFAFKRGLTERLR